MAGGEGRKKKRGKIKNGENLGNMEIPHQTMHALCMSHPPGFVTSLVYGLIYLQFGVCLVQGLELGFSSGVGV